MTWVTNALMIIASDHRRGAETFAVALSDELQMHEHRCTVVALRGDRRAEALPVPIIGSSRWDPIGMARLVALARRHEVVVGHGSSTLLNGSVASLFARRPFVYRNIGDPSVWGNRRCADLRIGLPLRGASAVAALYGEASQELCRRYRLDPARVRTIPNAVRADRFVPVDSGARASRRAELGLDADLRWVGFVGALSEEKRLHLAIDSIVRNPGLGLLVAGDGPDRAELEAHADRGAPGRVVFLGAVGDANVVYRAAELIVLPSRTEGLPAVVIEAGLCALPVVAAPVGGLAEIVVDGQTGRLVDPTDGSAFDAALWDCLDRADVVGRAARRHVEERFTLGPVAALWSELLQAVVSRPVSGLGGDRSTRGT